MEIVNVDGLGLAVVGLDDFVVAYAKFDFLQLDYFLVESKSRHEHNFTDAMQADIYFLIIYELGQLEHLLSTKS